jgi:uncharacterized protein YjbJ (UPF0337 family)
MLRKQLRQTGDGGPFSGFLAIGRSQEAQMTWDEIKGNWREYKGRLKEKWGELTDDDLDRIEGKRDQLLGVLQNRYGRTRERAENEIRDFEDNLTSVGGRSTR